MTARALSDKLAPEKLALKRAGADMVKGVGGFEAAAMFCRVGKSVLSEQCRPESDGFLSIDVVMDLEPLAAGRAGWPHVTRLMAAHQVFALVKLPNAPPEGSDLLLLLARQSKEAGDVASAICEALADQCVEPREARAVREQVRELIDVAVAMDAALAAIERAG